jgi:hypothetical protein
MAAPCMVVSPVPPPSAALTVFAGLMTLPV